MVTYWPEDAPASSPAGTVLADLRRLGIEVALEPLERAGVAALATEVGGGVLDADLDALVQVTGGNPLFVTEVVRLAARPAPGTVALTGELLSGAPRHAG